MNPSTIVFIPRALLEPVKLKHAWISYGDLWTLAGVVAVQAMGGPAVPWKPGRIDKQRNQECPAQGRFVACIGFTFCLLKKAPRCSARCSAFAKRV